MRNIFVVHVNKLHAGFRGVFFTHNYLFNSFYKNALSESCNFCKSFFRSLLLKKIQFMFDRFVTLCPFGLKK